MMRPFAAWVPTCRGRRPAAQGGRPGPRPAGERRHLAARAARRPSAAVDPPQAPRRARRAGPAHLGAHRLLGLAPAVVRGPQRGLAARPRRRSGRWRPSGRCRPIATRASAVRRSARWPYRRRRGDEGLSATSSTGTRRCSARRRTGSRAPRAGEPAPRCTRRSRRRASSARGGSMVGVPAPSPPSGALTRPSSSTVAEAQGDEGLAQGARGQAGAPGRRPRRSASGSGTGGR